MAYENMTYEFILQRMMDRVAEKYPNLDNREGSVIFNALAPAALELAILYTELDNTRNESFINTATREFILIACQDMGMDVTQFEASAGVHKGEFDVEIDLDSRWNCDLYNYVVTEFIGQNSETNYYEYKMRCETAGAAPNNQTGDLIAITDMPTDLTHARVVECLIEGENETSDDDIRTAYSEFVNSTITDGNVSQYEQWCREYNGIGNFKVFPCWNGVNTVKVSILNTSNTRASDALIEEFQNYLDPGSRGMGDGVAPIGAFVTVSTANEIKINVSADVKMKPGYSDTSNITTAITTYLSSVAYEKTSAAYMNIGAMILSVPGVESVSNLLVNGGTANIELGTEEIPVIGTTNWKVTQ